MGVDHAWVAVNKLVQAGLADADLLNKPPKSEQDIDDLATTITDHVVAAFELSPGSEGEQSGGRVVLPAPTERRWSRLSAA